MRARKTNISLPQEMEKQAKARARAEMRSFSSYVQWLIAQDLKRELAQPVPEPAAAAAQQGDQHGN